jgi:20S proteasome alpha/beta subunit
MKEESMGEVVKATGVQKEKGYLYYLGKDGNVWRSKMARAGKGGGNAEKVADAGVQREEGYLYYIDKNGNVARAKMARGRK